MLLWHLVQPSSLGSAGIGAGTGVAVAGVGVACGFVPVAAAGGFGEASCLFAKVSDFQNAAAKREANDNNTINLMRICVLVPAAILPMFPHVLEDQLHLAE